MKYPTVSRRRFLRNAGLAGAATILPGAGALANRTSAPDTGKTAKNLIFLVVDGMSGGTLGLAHHWMLGQHQEALHWTRLYDRPDLSRGFQDTASASSPVTDSAAAASAWGCGQRVPNRSINISESGQPLTPLYRFAKEAGKATGLVTTCRVTHATPAGFVANVPDRDAEDTIADQYLEREVDVILGGGLPHFDRSAAGVDGRNLLTAFENKGYRLADDKTSLRRAAGSRKLLGLFSDGHIPYAIDRENDSALAGTPGLSEMFSAALESLTPAKNGFVLQVEAGRVDHAGHANDPAAILREQLEFDRCIPIALAYLEKHPDTLVIITTDHGTGGCQLNGWGTNYNESAAALDRLGRFTASLENLAARFQAAGHFDPEWLAAATGITLDRATARSLKRAIKKEPEQLSRRIPQILAEPLFETTAVGWTSHNHTAELVEVCALGPGSRALPAFLRNNELFKLMTTALALRA